MTTTRVRSINLRGWEVPAIREGRATRLLRPIAVPDWADRVEPMGCDEVPHVDAIGRHPELGGCRKTIWCPWRPGDRLAGREAWSPDHAAFYPNFPVVYRAEGYPADWEFDPDGTIESPEIGARFPFRWRSAATMPRWAVRIHLDLLAVRPVRAGEITEAEAEAEAFGLDFMASADGRAGWWCGRPTPPYSSYSYLNRLRDLWDADHGRNPDLAWSDSPLCWLMDIRRAET